MMTMKTMMMMAMNDGDDDDDRDDATFASCSTWPLTFFCVCATPRTTTMMMMIDHRRGGGGDGGAACALRHSVRRVTLTTDAEAHRRPNAALCGARETSSLQEPYERERDRERKVESNFN